MNQRPLRVLFLCTHNSARSQMAEGLLRSTPETRSRSSSAGTEPGGVIPWRCGPCRRSASTFPMRAQSRPMSSGISTSITSSRSVTRPTRPALSSPATLSGSTGRFPIRVPSKETKSDDLVPSTDGARSSRCGCEHGCNCRCLCDRRRTPCHKGIWNRRRLSTDHR